MVAAGVQAHMHDDSMQCGSMLPLPLPHVAAPSDAWSEPVLRIEHVPNPSVVSLAPRPATGTQRALDAIARITSLVVATPHVPSLTQVHDVCTTPVGHGGKAITRMIAEAAAIAHAERGLVQAERDKCAATSRLLRRAGRLEQA